MFTLSVCQISVIRCSFWGKEGRVRRGGGISLYGPKLKSSSVVTFLVRFFCWILFRPQEGWESTIFVMV